jgi:hypothetical protein
MLNWFKVNGIRTAEKITDLNNPFKPFTRAAAPKYPELLSVKAQRFEDDLRSYQLANGVISYNLRSPLDLGDQALWHGVYTAGLAVKRSVDGQTTDMLDSAYKAFTVLFRNGKLIRGVDPLNSATFADDASNDSVTGMLAGMYFAWKYGNVITLPALQLLVDEVADNKFAIVNQDGTPTTYGQLENGWKTDPLRVTLAMALFAFAERIIPTPKSNYAWNFLVDHYAPLIPYAKARLMWLDTIYDTHRAALHLTILADLTRDTNKKVYALCIEGMSRLIAMTKDQANAWVLFLCARHIQLDPAVVQNAKIMLSEMTFEDKGAPVEVVLSTDPTIDKSVWNGEWVSRQPLPIWKRAPQDFIWQRSLYSLDGNAGNHDPTRIYNGGDYLCAYWLGRSLALIGNKE